MLAAALLVALAGARHPALATAINVTTTTDELNSDGDCSLREAIQAANTDAAVSGCPAGSGVDTISVPAGTYTLSIERTFYGDNVDGDLNITSGLVINGAGAGATIIQTCNTSHCLPFRIFHVEPHPPADVSISGVTIRNGTFGAAADVGGGILNDPGSELLLSNSSVIDNDRGGILNYGVLTVSDSTVTGNSGGGIYNAGGTLTVNKSTVSGNSGGGISNHGNSTATLSDSTVEGNTGDNGGGILNGSGSLTAMNSTISGNTASGGGGGIYNNQYSTATLTNSTVEGNTADDSSGGGIHNYGALTLSNSTITGNHGYSGAGIYNAVSTTAGILTLTDSTVSENVAVVGGGIFNDGGTIIVTNSTVSGNSASGAGSINGGGGVRNEGGVLTLTNSTVTGNASNFGAGIKNSSLVGVPSTTLKNTIVANNTSGGGCDGLFISQGHNLSSDSTCAFSGPGDMNSTDPMLGPLANNGGPTQTHALLTGSPAIDAGGDCPPPTTDQRGASRPQDGDGNGSAICDIGAFEREAAGTPGPVGGIALDAQVHRSSGPDAGRPAGGVAAAMAVAITLGGTAWYARRRH